MSGRDFWSGFQSYLSNNNNHLGTRDRLNYAIKYAHMLDTYNEKSYSDDLERRCRPEFLTILLPIDKCPDCVLIGGNSLSLYNVCHINPHANSVSNYIKIGKDNNLS
jgi:hypothetical protein